MATGSVEQPPRPAPLLSGLARWLYTILIKLYPRPFYLAFHEEMIDIFDQMLTESQQQGRGFQLRLLLRELGELPVAVLLEHVYQVRKKTMSTMRLRTTQEVNLIRWLARIMSLSINGLVWTIFLFNEDVRQEPTLPLVLVALLTLALLAGLRWEKRAGVINVIGAPLLFVALLAYNLSQPNQLLSLWSLLFTAATLAGAFLMTGWLYLSVARYDAVAGLPAGSDAPPTSTGRRRLFFALALILAVAVLGLAFAGITTPTTQQVSMAPQVSPAIDELIVVWRTEGVVVGVGSPPAALPFATVPGQLVLIGAETVTIFEYPTAAAARQDAEAILQGDAPGWTDAAAAGPVYLFRDGRLLLFYANSDAATLALLRGTVGPPLLSAP